MKHIILSLSLLTVASVSTEAQVKIGNNPVAISSNSSLQLGSTSKGFLASKPNLTNNETSLFVNPGEKKLKAKSPDKPSESDEETNKFRFFIGAGNTDVFADVVTLTSRDKTFVGELGWQVRGGVRLFDNYEINFGVYGRQMPTAINHPGFSYNKFLGYSGALMYEFKIADRPHWGVPFGFEVLKYTKNIDFEGTEGASYYHHYTALAYGPKIGLRYHISDLFFVEAELATQYEQFKSDLNSDEKSYMEANKLGSFKFFGVSLNRGF